MKTPVRPIPALEISKKNQDTTNYACLFSTCNELMYDAFDFHVISLLNQSLNDNQLVYLYPQNADNDIDHMSVQYLSTKFE